MDTEVGVIWAEPGLAQRVTVELGVAPGSALPPGLGRDPGGLLVSKGMFSMDVQHAAGNCFWKVDVGALMRSSAPWRAGQRGRQQHGVIYRAASLGASPCAWLCLSRAVTWC